MTKIKIPDSPKVENIFKKIKSGYVARYTLDGGKVLKIRTAQPIQRHDSVVLKDGQIWDVAQVIHKGGNTWIVPEVHVADIEVSGDPNAVQA